MQKVPRTSNIWLQYAAWLRSHQLDQAVGQFGYRSCGLRDAEGGLERMFSYSRSLHCRVRSQSEPSLRDISHAITGLTRQLLHKKLNGLVAGGTNDQ